MKRIVLRIVGGAMIAAIAFVAGRGFGNFRPSAARLFTVTRPLELHASATDVGTLPASTVMYFYRRGPDTTTYVVFINFEHPTDLSPRPPDPRGYDIVPITAWAPE